MSEEKSRKRRRDAPSVVVEAYRLHQVLDPSVREALSDGPLDPDDFGLYNLLAQHQPLTAGAFAELSGIPPSTLSAVIKRFTGRGHVARVTDPDDRRVVRLALTQEGQAALDACSERFSAFAARVQHHLGAHEEATRMALALVSSALVAASRTDEPERAPIADTLQFLSYDGAALSDSQTAEVQRFIRWIRWRDT